MSKSERSLTFGEEFLEKLGKKPWYSQVCLQVFSDGDQTLKWFPSSSKGEIVGIMANVLSLMETYFIKMSKLC